MINISDNKIEGHINEPILRWEVWFWTPVGVAQNRDMALARVRELDMPDTTVVPVPVAITETSYEISGR